MYSTRQPYMQSAIVNACKSQHKYQEMRIGFGWSLFQFYFRTLLSDEEMHGCTSKEVRLVTRGMMRDRGRSKKY